jgi:hypothetical protein
MKTQNHKCIKQKITKSIKQYIRLYYKILKNIDDWKSIFEKLTILLLA